MPRLVSALLLASTFVTTAQIALAQTPLTAFPNNYKMILDNADLTVIRVHYGPHEKIGVHDHSNFPTLYVYLDDSGPVRFTHDETPPFVMTRPPAKTGSFRLAPARPERHSVENLSDQPSDFLRIEFKKLAGTGIAKPMRGAVPDPLKPGVTEDFKSQQLTIHRVVCDPGPACPTSTGANTLYIALSPTVVQAMEPGKAFHNQVERQLQNGDIEWQPGATAISVHTTTSTPAHLLEVTLSQPVQ